MMVLRVENVTKRFGDHVAVDGLSLQVKEHECLALLGPNGSGKTTILNMLTSLLKPTSGSIGFKKDKVGYLPQYPAFYDWMSAQEYLKFMGSLSQIPKEELRKRIDEMLQFVGLEDARTKRIGGFSGGMKQRLGLAQALINEPDILILDEPVSALDPEGRRDVLDLMLGLKEKLTIIFSTHVLHDAEQVCDRVIMLQKGVTKWGGSLADLRAERGQDLYRVCTKEAVLPYLNARKDVQIENVSSDHSALIQLVGNLSSNELLQDLLTNAFTMETFAKENKSLETLYLEVVGK